MSSHISISTTTDGQYVTCTGDRFDGDRHPNETAKLIRREIRDAVKAGDLPDMKYSVRRGHGWHDVSVTVLADPDEWALVDGAVLLSDPWATHRRVLSAQAKHVGATIAGIGARYMRTTRDPLTDYFAGGYFLVYASTTPGGGLSIG